MSRRKNLATYYTDDEIRMEGATQCYHAETPDTPCNRIPRWAGIGRGSGIHGVSL